MSGSLLVFRGALLSSDVVSQFALEQNRSTEDDGLITHHYVNLPGVTSTSTNYRVALKFAKINSQMTKDDGK